MVGSDVVTTVFSSALIKLKMQSVIMTPQNRKLLLYFSGLVPSEVVASLELGSSRVILNPTNLPEHWNRQPGASHSAQK